MIVIFILIVFLAVFAGTRVSIDNDFEVYSTIFKNAILYQVETKTLAKMEPSFFIIPRVAYFFSAQYAVRICFLIFAFIGVSTKMLSLKNADFLLLSVALYVSYLFFMQEMTTIRAGVASGIFLLSIKDLTSKNDKAFFIKLIMAIFFHYSSILFLAIWVLIRLNLSLRIFCFLLIISFLMAFLKVNIIHLFYLDVIFPKIKIYLDLMVIRKDAKPNVFNFRILFALFVTIICLLKLKILNEKPFFPVLFKVHLLSLSLFFLFSSTANVFSLRTFELLSVVQILLYPMIVYLFKERIIGFSIVFLFAVVQFYYIIYPAHLLLDYNSWLLK